MPGNSLLKASISTLDCFAFLFFVAKILCIRIPLMVELSLEVGGLINQKPCRTEPWRDLIAAKGKGVINEFALFGGHGMMIVVLTGLTQ